MARIRGFVQLSPSSAKPKPDNSTLELVIPIGVNSLTLIAMTRSYAIHTTLNEVTSQE